MIINLFENIFKKKVVSKITFLAFFVLICALFVALLFYFVGQKEKEKNTAFFISNTIVPTKQEEISHSLPIRLKIPSIKVDAAVESVGLTPDGRVDVPKGPSGVAWFNLGPRPGEPGSSVIDGHSGWRNDIPAAFDDLHKLKLGDKIYIEDSNGAIITFVAREFRSFGKDEEVSIAFISNDTQAHLNLITCSGDWNAREKSHSKRLIVFTDKVIY